MLDIISLLLANAELRGLIGNNIYPNHTSYLGECVLYDFHTISNNRKVKRVRLQITIIADSIANSVAIEDAIQNVLLTLGDEPLVGDTLQVASNGGGTLFDSSRDKHHRILYYDIIQRGEN